MTSPSYIKTSVALFFLTGCASPRLHVESTPIGAEVSVTLQDKTRKTLGITPLDITNEELMNLGKETLNLQVRKEGYEPFSTLIPPNRFAFEADLNVSLKESLGSDSKNIEALGSEVAEATAEIIRLIKKRDFAEAQRLVNNQMIRYPHASVFLDLQGNIYYLQKRVDEALTAYKASLKITPEKPETKRIVERLEMLRGGRTPATASSVNSEREKAR